MRGIWIWGVAVLAFGGFLLWYDNFGGPLTADEIDAYMAEFAASPDFDPERAASVRAFLEADDGGEFFMVNLIRMFPGPVLVPGSGDRRPAAEVLRGYTGEFMPALLRHAGHPAFAGPAAGRYLESWGVEPDPGWTFAAVIRYRSRRDLMELATDPFFRPAHAFKIAAMANTLAFPVTPQAYLGPRIVVGLGLALLAALIQLAARRRA